VGVEQVPRLTLGCQSSDSTPPFVEYNLFMMKVSSNQAHDLLAFINNSPSPFHAVQSIKQRLGKAGFQEIKERNDWASICRPGGRYFLTRNASTVCAFAIGKDWKPGNPVAMIGTIDSRD